MKTELLPISAIKPNPNNPRVIKDDKFEKLVASIKEFPKMLEIRPIVVNDDMIVLGGNMRLKACKAAGLKEVPVLKASDLTEDEQRQFIIKDNVSGGEWDWDMLANEWDVGQLEEWGLDVPINLETELEAVEDDFNEEPPEEPITILGDLYEIGEHRLLCGDSTDSDLVAKLMDGSKADVAHNDPPYGMKKENEGVLNDNLNYSDLLDFNKEWIPLQFMHLKENGSWYCWGIDEPLMDIYSDILKPYIKNGEMYFRNLITWDKGNGQGQLSPTRRSFAVADEKCLFVMIGKDGKNKKGDDFHDGFTDILNWLKSEKEKSGLNNAQILSLTSSAHSHYWTKSQWLFPTEKDYNALKKASNGVAFVRDYNELKKEYEKIKNELYASRSYFDNLHDNMNNVWHIKRTSQQERADTGKHATPKPIPLCERAIKSSCPDGGLVLDFFLGSGSTMVASHQLNRKCYGMELDPKYCDVIVRRMIKLDPSIKVKRNGQLIDNNIWHTTE
jgi:DNA modification methylase